MVRTKISSLLVFLSTVSAGMLAHIDAAQAALLGGVSFSPVPAVDSGVLFSGTGVNAPGTINPLTDIDFTPPIDGGNGIIVELSAGVPEPDDFLPFIGEEGTIQDVTVAESESITPTSPLVGFINIPNAFRFDLENIGFPSYDGGGGDGTTISIRVEGKFVQLFDDPETLENDIGSVSIGVGTFSADFAGLSIDETRALFDEPGEQFGPNSYSATFVATEQAIPESSNLVTLLGLGLIGGVMIIRQRKHQAD